MNPANALPSKPSTARGSARKTYQTQIWRRNNVINSGKPKPEYLHEGTLDSQKTIIRIPDQEIQ